MGKSEEQPSFRYNASSQRGMYKKGSKTAFAELVEHSQLFRDKQEARAKRLDQMAAVRKTRKPMSLSNLEAIVPPTASIATLVEVEAEMGLGEATAAKLDEHIMRTRNRGSSCSIREENISRQSIHHQTQLSLLNQVGIGVGLRIQQEKIVKNSNYRKNQARMQQLIKNYKYAYGSVESSRSKHKPAPCITAIGGMQLMDMTMSIANATK